MEKADQLFDKGCRAITRNRHREAEQYLTRALAIRPDWHDALQRRALARESSGKLRGAISDYRRALRVDPRCDYCWVPLGDLYALLKDDARALDCYQRAIRLKPREASYKHDLGQTQLRMGRYRAAARTFESIRERKGFRLLWREGRGRALALIGETFFALRDLEACVRMRPDCDEVWFYRGLAKLKAHDEGGARKDLSKARKLGRRIPPMERLGTGAIDRLLRSGSEPSSTREPTFHATRLELGP